MCAAVILCVCVNVQPQAGFRSAVVYRCVASKVRLPPLLALNTFWVLTASFLLHHHSITPNVDHVSHHGSALLTKSPPPHLLLSVHCQPPAQRENGTLSASKPAGCRLPALPVCRGGGGGGHKLSLVSFCSGSKGPEGENALGLPLTVGMSGLHEV